MLTHVNRRITNAVAREMVAEHGLTLPQFEVLSEVMQQPTGVKLGDLARRIAMTNGNITRLVCRLEEKRYVARKGMADKRISMIFITAAGAELMTAAIETHRGLMLSQCKTADIAEVLAAAVNAGQMED